MEQQQSATNRKKKEFSAFEDPNTICTKSGCTNCPLIHLTVFLSQLKLQAKCKIHTFCNEEHIEPMKDVGLDNPFPFPMLSDVTYLTLIIYSKETMST